MPNRVCIVQAWPTLLGCYGQDISAANAHAVNKDAEQHFAILCEQVSLPDAYMHFDASSGGETWEHNTRRIATDVNRTDLGSRYPEGNERVAMTERLTRVLTAYAYSDPQVGYCQGMSDILAPFLEVYPKDDALAYLCFSALMQRIRSNFLEGQPGIHTSLQQITSLLQKINNKLCKQIDKKDMGTGVYAFRMLVCQFRREMAFDDIFAFWERLWAAEQLAGTQLKVHCIVALLQLHRKHILRLKAPEDFVQYMNKDIVPMDGLAVVKGAYKLWKQHDKKKQKPQAASSNWSRPSKADVSSPRPTDAVNNGAHMPSSGGL